MTAPTTTTNIDSPKPREHVARRIREAAETTGVPFDFLLAQANQESRLNPNATSKRSSATGLYQFTKGTWLDMVKQHGAEHGLERYADAITADRNGRPVVEDKTLRKEILDLRRDPKMSALMAAEYAKDNEQYLEGRLGRQVSAQDLYLAHFLGAAGAARVLEGVEDNPKRSAASSLPDAARANPDVFHEPGSGRQRSFASLYKKVLTSYDRAVDSVAGLASRSRSDLDLASLRPETRPRMQWVAVETRQQVAMAEPAITDSSTLPPPVPRFTDFANAMEPETPFFPVTLPPAAPGQLRASGPILRLMLQDMEDGKA